MCYKDGVNFYIKFIIIELIQIFVLWSVYFSYFKRGKFVYDCFEIFTHLYRKLLN